MKHTLFCFIFLTALQDGNTGLVNAETPIRRVKEGENITVACKFYFTGQRKLFCKEKCEGGGILVETSADAAQKGRYSIKYGKNSRITSYHILYVTITQLKKSDSGQYRCSLDRLGPDPNDDFEIVVTEASTTSIPNVTLRSFSAPGFLSLVSTPPTLCVSSGSGSSTPPSASTPPPPTLSVSSGSGSSTPPSASSGSSDVLLYMGLILVVMISIFLAALLIFYKKKKRATKPRGPPAETASADREDNRLYEEIRECDVPSCSPPVEVSSVYATVKGPQPDGGESMSLYSLVASPQNKVEDNSNNLSYSAVDISLIPATCRVPCGDATDVVYSIPQVDPSAANHTREASPPLYSSVTSV